MNRDWCVKVGKSFNPGVYHPFMDLPVKALLELCNYLRILSGKADDISCHYELKAATDNDKIQRDIYRCNPKYRGNAWFDWINIAYQCTTRERAVYESIVPARLYLWMSYFDTDQQCTHIHALIQSLHRYDTPTYPHCTVLHGNSMSDVFTTVNFHTSVRSVAFLLPAVNSRNTLQSQASKDWIQSEIVKNQYYIIIPRQSEWKN